MRRFRIARIGLVALAALTSPLPSIAAPEVVEEIVAKINDDVITKSELENEEQSVLAELYRQYSGAELDKQVARTRKEMLRRLIDNKVLYHRAFRLYDMEKMGDYILREFKSREKFKSDQDLEKQLAQEGMTLADFKRRLVEMYSPQEVIRYEVSDRTAVSDAEVQAYYEGHLEEFDVKGQVTLREIVVLADAAQREAKRAEAQAIRDRAAAPGADFAAIAKESSAAGTRESGGLLGPLKQGDISPILEQAAFAQPVGEVGPVLEADYGFHIVKVESRQDGRRKGLDEVREELGRRLYAEKFQAALDAFLRKAWGEATIHVMPPYDARLAPEWLALVQVEPRSTLQGAGP